MNLSRCTTNNAPARGFVRHDFIRLTRKISCPLDISRVKADCNAAEVNDQNAPSSCGSTAAIEDRIGGQNRDILLIPNNVDCPLVPSTLPYVLTLRATCFVLLRSGTGRLGRTTLRFCCNQDILRTASSRRIKRTSILAGMDLTVLRSDRTRSAYQVGSLRRRKSLP